MVTGSSSNPVLQGSNFATKDAIYVNFNYRESVFASPYSSELVDGSNSQNFGILDVEAAMEWIHANIQGKRYCLKCLSLINQISRFRRRPNKNCHG